MRNTLRAFLLALTVALVTLGVLPTAQASYSPVFTVQDSTAYEYYWTCSSSSPYTCSTTGLSVHVPITANYPSSVPITIGYEIVDMTTTAGQDYSVATSGTVTMPAWQPAATVLVPLLNDGAVEPTETFQVRLTSSSAGGNISDTGIGTVRDGSQIPSDCTLTRSNAYTASISCGSRPAGGQWYHKVVCQGWGAGSVNGNTVTGNGTSTASCPTNQTYRASTFETIS